MTDSATIDRADELERKIDALSAQVQFLTDEALAQRRGRIALEELRADLTPIAMSAVERTAYTLDDQEIDPGDLLQLAARVAANARMLDSALAQLESLAALARDLQPIVGQGVEMAIATTARFEERGYFEFAGAAGGVVERIVTNYSAEDVEALGDNVVQILDIVKDLTQPEVLAVAQRALDAVQRQTLMAGAVEEEPPGLFALARKLRDPEVRRGMGRALDTLAAVSAADAAADSQPATENTTDTNHTQGGA
jgi:uncharacterized protein YjgD (DUF1641 family)